MGQSGNPSSPIEKIRRFVRNPDDAPVLAGRLSLGCDIVSGDKDLQGVHRRGASVWKPSELVRWGLDRRAMAEVATAERVGWGPCRGGLNP